MGGVVESTGEPRACGVEKEVECLGHVDLAGAGSSAGVADVFCVLFLHHLHKLQGMEVGNVVERVVCFVLS